jgi:cysteinyl-tRNA synthetase
MIKLKLYNTLSRSLSEFTPITPGHIGIYCCGPTVYNFAHIGNLRTYIFEDLLVRTFRYLNFKINHVMNITDVGHLVSDQDEGEDKMALATKREGKKSAEIAEYYTKAFFNDCLELNIIEPNIVCKATDHILEMIELIKTLVEKDFAYQSNGNVYFDVAKFKDYGKLAGLSLESLVSGARIEIDEAKRNPQDFALWFTKSKFENQELQWDSPWGKGYPGWHIECSAMSIKYLGPSFDIHCGGIDHIPVHHTNEIAQSECATGKKFANFWLHGGFLVENENQKMSKSKGDFLTLAKLKSEGFNAMAYRYFCLTSHYRGELSWSWDALKGAENSLNSLIQKISSLISNCKDFRIQIEKSENFNAWKDEFSKRISNDINIPQSLACLYEMLADKNLIISEKILLTEDFDQVLGLNLISKAEENNLKTITEIIPDEIMKLASDRENARKTRDFKKADFLRAEIENKGYTLKDTSDGPKILRK